MKIQLEPQKKCRQPKYIAAIGVLSSAALLTGCGGGDVALGGEPVVCTDVTEIITTTVQEPELEGLPVLCTDETESIETQPEIGGEVYLPEQDIPAEPLTLEGDVAFVPDYEETAAVPEDTVVFQDAFAAQGLIMDKDCRKFSHYGVTFTSVLKNAENGIRLVFFDGSMTDGETAMRDWLGSVCTETYDWGCVLEYPADPEGIDRAVFVDVSSTDTVSPAFAETVYQDICK